MCNVQMSVLRLYVFSVLSFAFYRCVLLILLKKYINIISAQKQMVYIYF